MTGSTSIRMLLAVSLITGGLGAACGTAVVFNSQPAPVRAYASAKVGVPAPPPPTRVEPTAEEVEAHRAQKLGLGSMQAAGLLLAAAPISDWIDAIEATPQDTLHWPVEGGRYGRGFGYVRAHLPDVRHDGVDITAPIGTPVGAAATGLVAYADDGVRGYGNTVILVHPDGSSTLYAHLDSIAVRPGALVSRGQTIGTVGETGRARGPHLHFELRIRGQARNPMGRFANRVRS